MQLISRGSMYAAAATITTTKVDDVSIITTAPFATATVAPKSLKHHTKHAEHKIKICKSIEIKRNQIEKTENRESTAAATTNDRMI